MKCFTVCFGNVIILKVLLAVHMVQCTPGDNFTTSYFSTEMSNDDHAGGRLGDESVITNLTAVVYSNITDPLSKSHESQTLGNTSQVSEHSGTSDFEKDEVSTEASLMPIITDSKTVVLSVAEKTAAAGDQPNSQEVVEKVPRTDVPDQSFPPTSANSTHDDNADLQENEEELDASYIHRNNEKPRIGSLYSPTLTGPPRTSKNKTKILEDEEHIRPSQPTRSPFTNGPRTDMSVDKEIESEDKVQVVQVDDLGEGTVEFDEVFPDRTHSDADFTDDVTSDRMHSEITEEIPTSNSQVVETEGRRGESDESNIDRNTELPEIGSQHSPTLAGAPRSSKNKTTGAPLTKSQTSPLFAMNKSEEFSLFRARTGPPRSVGIIHDEVNPEQPLQYGSLTSTTGEDGERVVGEVLVLHSNKSKTSEGHIKFQDVAVLDLNAAHSTTASEDDVQHALNSLSVNISKYNKYNSTYESGFSNITEHLGNYFINLPRNAEGAIKIEKQSGAVGVYLKNAPLSESSRFTVNFSVNHLEESNENGTTVSKQNVREEVFLAHGTGQGYLPYSTVKADVHKFEAKLRNNATVVEKIFIARESGEMTSHGTQFVVTPGLIGVEVCIQNWAFCGHECAKGPGEFLDLVLTIESHVEIISQSSSLPWIFDFNKGAFLSVVVPSEVSLDGELRYDYTSFYKLLEKDEKKLCRLWIPLSRFQHEGCYALALYVHSSKQVTVEVNEEIQSAGETEFSTKKSSVGENKGYSFTAPYVLITITLSFALLVICNDRS